MTDFEKLLEVLRQTRMDYDLEAIIRAHEIADAAHSGQTRKSGEPFITHPVAVADILAGLGMDTDTIVAALLHDVVEDTQITIDEVKKKFGADVALLVDGVTKLGRIPFSSMRCFLVKCSSVNMTLSKNRAMAFAEYATCGRSILCWGRSAVTSRSRQWRSTLP